MSRYCQNRKKEQKQMQVLNRSLQVLILAVSLLLTAASAPATLSVYSETVAKIIGFDRQVLIIMKEESGGSIHRMVGYDENDFQIVVDGVSVPVPEEKTEEILHALRKKLTPLKYMAFVIEMNESINMDKIGVLKGTDQYQILTIMHTDGDQYDISNEDVIERLRDWEKTSPLDIIGAGNDWVEIEFRTLPKDLKSFVEEVYDFCPDAVEQGPGSTADLARDIQQTKKLFLWWD
jgi:hypothetical protein